MFENWRFNPFTGVMHAVLIEDESHTIEYHADWNAYGIQLNEAPRLDNPSTVEIVEDVTGGSTFSELPRTQAPAAGQYRVDYDALTYYGTGRVEFAAADVGKAVLVSYYGTGWTVKNRYPMGQTTIPTQLEVTEDAVIHGNLDLDGENTGGGDIHVAGDVTVDGDIIGNLIGSAGGILETGAGASVVHKKIIPIPSWNMDSTAVHAEAHGITDAINKIRSIDVIIIADSETACYPFLAYSDNLGHVPGRIVIDATNISISRFDGGYYDNVGFDRTDMVRGYITIGYID
jgi:hypothetical protein